MEKRIQYQVSANNAGFDKAIDSIERKMKDARTTFNRELRGINTDMNGTQKVVGRMGQAANDAFGVMGAKLRSDFKGLGVAMAAAFSVVAIKNFAAESKTALLESQSSFRGLESIANSSGIGIGRAMAEAQKLTADGLMTVTDASKSLQNLLSRGYNIDQAVETINRLKDAAAFNRQANLGLSDAVLTATEGLKNENSILVDNAGVTKNVSKMWEEYASKIGKTRDQLSQTEKIQAEHAGIMRETSAQVGNAAKAAEGLSGSQADLEKSSLDLKITVGTLLEPAFVTLNKTLADTSRFFNDMFRSMGGLQRSIPEIEGDIARLEVSLSNLSNKRRGANKQTFERTLDDLKSELQAARLTSLDAEQVSKGIAELTLRIVEQQKSVDAAAAGGDTTRSEKRGRTTQLTAYGREMVALEQLQAQLVKTIEHQNALKAAIKDKPTSEDDATGGAGSTSRVNEWQSVLDAQKLAHQQQQSEQGTYHQFSLSKEAEYWQSVLQREDIKSGERIGVQRKYLAALTAERRQSEGVAFADLQAQAQQYRNNMDARLQIAQQTLQRSAQLYGTDSREYQRAATEVVAIEREKQQQIQNMRQQELAANQKARLADIAHAEQMAQLAVQDGVMTQQQLLAAQQEFENRKYEIERNALEQRRLLLEQDPDRNPVAMQQVQQQMLELQRQHSNNIQLISQRQSMESRSNWAGMMGSLQQTWTNGLNGILTGTMSTQGLLKGIFSSIGVAFIDNMVTKPLMAWLFGETAKTTATVTGVAARGAAEEVGAVKSVLLWAGVAVKNILVSGYQAMAAAFAAMAAIPIIGPALGVIAAAAAGAFVFGLVKNVASAEGGYDIPAGTNPLTQLHEQEMVLPKQYANVIRNAASGEGGLGGGGDTINYHDNSGRLSPSEIRRNVGVIAKELQRLRRNNGVSIA